MSPRELDEDDVRVRPGRGSRPRTRTRPAHEDAAAGGRAHRRPRPLPARHADDGQPAHRRAGPRAGPARRRRRRPGRRRRRPGGGPDALGRIVRIEPRTSLLRRTPDDTDPVERAVVANAEVLVVVTALADPVPRPRLVDRCLVAAYDGGLVPLLCLTKDDLAAARRAARRCTSRSASRSSSPGPAEDDPGVEVLRRGSPGRTSVLFGQSGVGKSTLVNRLVPGRRPGRRRRHRRRQGPAHARRRPSRWSCPAAARSSTPRACGRSGSARSRPSGCSRPSPTSPRPRRPARRAATT